MANEENIIKIISFHAYIFLLFSLNQLLEGTVQSHERLFVAGKAVFKCQYCLYFL